jgi:uncharacterized protein YcbX
MAGEKLDEVTLGPRGILGDRAWAVRDEVRGGIRGAKRFPQLMNMRASYGTAPQSAESMPADIQFEDGSMTSSSDLEINSKLSHALGNKVTLWPLLPADELEHYRRGKPGSSDMVAELRSVFGREPDEELPDLSAFPRELIEFESPPGTYFDAFPLLLLTTNSLDTMQDRVQGSNFDVRRFRPNLLISDVASAHPFPELEWIGKSLQIGTSILNITLGCPRCIMVTHGFDDLPKDPGIMRSLVREAEGSLGVYAEVRKPGEVRAGDEINLID